MSNVRVTREDWIEQSVISYARAALVARGFPTGEWEMLDSYPYGLTTLDVNKIACGFTFDDGGKQAECGSNLKERQHTIEFFVFGKTNTYAKSLANAIKFSLEADMIIPLMDITQVGTPVVDTLIIDQVHSRRQPLPDPEPWQEFTWYVIIQVTDYYVPAMT